MSWLAPWALGAGALGMMGVIALHLLTRERPRALLLATARFLPDGVLESTAIRRIPTDRWWMLLRLLILLLLGAGVAQPVLRSRLVASRTVLLLDRTLPDAVQQRMLASLQPSDVVIAFDSLATLKAPAADAARVSRESSLSAALALYARVRDSLMASSVALNVTLASTFLPTSLDPVSAELRALIPDSITVLALTVPPPPTLLRAGATVHAAANDPIAATVVLLGDGIARAGTIVQRGPMLTRDDSVAAQKGTTVVWWPARVTRDPRALRALTIGDATWIAPFEPNDSTQSARAGERAVGWWADGAPAVWERHAGLGCVLRVNAGLPLAGDQSLSLSAQRWVATLLTHCDPAALGVQAAPAWVAPAPPRRVLTDVAPVRHSVLAPWLIGLALLLALAELLLRPRVRA
jgi:Aerotolerance regulator N-terminal